MEFEWINGELVQKAAPEVPQREKVWYMTNEERRIEFQKNIVEQHAWQTCLNCEEWSDGTKHGDGNTYPVGCIKFQAVPPPHVIVYGCKDYQDQIPF